ncbi:hypothetical protein TRIUR3_08675 [Triticum urartu]|uniref:Uncharacterized protein n=1 Tax=Triticum urartu TaxID=4572 RepID=M8A102_TRIUA|nr:hypothetical protein TRIUR3_08675 [Triticum urartu]
MVADGVGAVANWRSGGGDGSEARRRGSCSAVLDSCEIEGGAGGSAIWQRSSPDQGRDRELLETGVAGNRAQGSETGRAQQGAHRPELMVNAAAGSRARGLGDAPVAAHDDEGRTMGARRRSTASRL